MVFSLARYWMSTHLMADGRLLLPVQLQQGLTWHMYMRKTLQ